MARTFVHLRVSSARQATENQIHENEAAGFKVELRRVISETVSGSSALSNVRAASSITRRVQDTFGPRRNRQNDKNRDSLIYQQALSGEFGEKGMRPIN